MADRNNLTLSTLVLGVLPIAWALLWLDSRSTASQLDYTRTGVTVDVASAPQLYLRFSTSSGLPDGFRWTRWRFPVPRGDASELFWTPAKVEGGWRWLGFDLSSYLAGGTSPTHQLGLPHWFLTSLLAVPVVRRIGRSIRSHVRARKGLCRACGYDLRALPEGGRCPECGAEVTRPTVE